MSQSEIVVEGRNLTIGYQVGKKRTEVHSRLNFQLFRGELTCLLGANGAGKSTLLRTLAAAQPFLSGDIVFYSGLVTNFNIVFGAADDVVGAETSIAINKPRVYDPA
jgi:ABC-type cobalamin/Fe3+-siderophores transport system ATPase subunit